MTTSFQRIAVYGTVKSLRKELQKAEERQKNAYEEALQVNSDIRM